MDVLPLQEFRRLDRNSEALGVPVERLMANAGKALADAIQAHRGQREVVLLCGKGNNGGDGFAAAGLLQRWGTPYTVVLMEPSALLRGAAKAYFELLPADRVRPWKGSRRGAWEDALVVDCMLGSGISGRPRAPYDAAIKWCQDRTVLACDVPSGLGTDLATRPKWTVTFHAAKQGMDRSSCGRIEVAPIGIPTAAVDIGPGDLAAGFVPARPDSHKGDNGRILVIGGGPFHGAPHYAGMAALRSGADLVHVAAPAAAAQVMRTWGPELMVHDACPGDALSMDALPVIHDLLPRVDTVVIGPGLGRSDDARQAAHVCIDAACQAGKTVVVDADGLDAVDAGLLKAHAGRLVLTPHAREFQDLTGWQPNQANVSKHARKHGLTIVRKGEVDVVAGPDLTRSCKRGDPAMTVGGTGDVLAGAIAALLARGASPFDAACAGVYLTCVAGEVAASVYGAGLTATDVIATLPGVLRSA